MGAGKATTRLTIATASSLRFALPELKAKFEKSHPSIKMEAIYGSSGQFFAQIQQGAPFDLFLAAEKNYIDKLISDNLILAQDARVFGFGRLVFWVNKKLGLKPDHKLTILKSHRLNRMVIPNPKLAPYGKAAFETLTALSLTKKWKNKVLLSKDANSAAIMLDRGGVEAGFLPISVVTHGSLANQGYWIEIPNNLHSPIKHTAGILKNSKNMNGARLFLKWLGSPEAWKTLRHSGF